MNKRHYEHTLPNIRGSLSNTYVPLSIEGSDNVIQAAKPADGETEAIEAKELTTQSGYLLPVTYTSNNVTLSFKVTVKQGSDVIKSDYIKSNLQPTGLSQHLIRTTLQ